MIDVIDDRGKPREQETVTLADGRLLAVHAARICTGPPCPVHAPSEHPLRAAPLGWVDGLGLMVRVCSHGRQHPDVDGLTHLHRLLGDQAPTFALSHHHCCGCCVAQPELGCEE